MCVLFGDFKNLRMLSFELFRTFFAENRSPLAPRHRPFRDPASKRHTNCVRFAKPFDVGFSKPCATVAACSCTGVDTPRASRKPDRARQALPRDRRGRTYRFGRFVPMHEFLMRLAKAKARARSRPIRFACRGCKKKKSRTSNKKRGLDYREPV